MLRIAVLIKQVPKAEEFALDASGRLQRDGVATEINAYCRRAISKGVELAKQYGGTCTVLTLGPPSAADALREALAWGADSAVHICGAEFAGSDTIATARSLVAALEWLDGVDLVLTGRNSIDSDTGQVPAQIAELLDLPFVGSARRLEVARGGLRVHCELDDGWTDVEVRLPAVVSCAERLCEPTKVKPNVWAEVPIDRIQMLTAADLGGIGVGQAGSPTAVGEVRVHEVHRARKVLDGPVAVQVAEAIELMRQRGALGDRREVVLPTLPMGRQGGPVIVALAAPDRARTTRELCGAAAVLAAQIGGTVAVMDAAGHDPAELASWGGDKIVQLVPADDTRGLDESGVAGALGAWCEQRRPWAVLAPATMWGREITGRLAARLDAGLTGDAVDLTVDDGRLVCWKPAFAGRLVAAVRTSSLTQLATVRPDALPLHAPREVPVAPPVSRLRVKADPRLVIRARGRDDDLDLMLCAHAVVGVGAAVAPEDHAHLGDLCRVLGAELGATRKVTDKGWLPRARQIGLTGHSISPRLYLAVGASGKFNHMVGVSSAQTVVAINRDVDAPVFEMADIGLVGDWRDLVDELVRQLS